MTAARETTERLGVTFIQGNDFSATAAPDAEPHKPIPRHKSTICFFVQNGFEPRNSWIKELVSVDIFCPPRLFYLALGAHMRENAFTIKNI